MESLLRHATVLALAATLVGGCRTVRPLPGRADLMADPLCAALDNTFRCARAIEARELAASGGVASRVGDTLVLRLEDGQAVRLADDGPGTVAPLGGEWASYSFVGRLPGIPYYLLHAQYGEGNAYTLVHARTGWIGLVEGWPLPSPYGRWLLIAEDGYFNAIGVYLYSVNTDSLTKAWELRPEDWAPGHAAWHGSTRAEVARMQDTGVPTDTARVLGRLALEYSRGRWSADVQ